MKRAKKGAQLKKLFEDKRAGKRQIDSLDVDEKDIYEEVNEQEYAKIVRERRSESRFVVDDMESGDYFDDGSEFFKNRKKAKIEKGRRAQGVDNITPRIDEFMRRQKPDLPAKKYFGDKADKELEELFAELDEDGEMEAATISASTPQKSVKRDFELYNEPDSIDTSITIEKVKPVVIDDNKKIENTIENTTVQSNTINKNKPEEDPENVFDITTTYPTPLPATVNVSGSTPKSGVTCPGGANYSYDINKCLKFFWFDAYEDSYEDGASKSALGTVFLFGKSYSYQHKKLVSCCLVCKDISRHYFFLPKKDITKSISQQLRAIYDELLMTLPKKHNIMKFRSKECTKKYAFEDRANDVPAEASYLHVSYSGKYPPLSKIFKGNSFSHVFGTHSNCLEWLLLHSKLKGPGWINVSGVTEIKNTKTSFCQIEFQVEQPEEKIHIIEDQLPLPSVSVMSIALQTTLNHKTHFHEILTASILFHPNVSLEGATDSRKTKLIKSTLMRSILGKRLIVDDSVKVEIQSDERSLLIHLLGKIQQLDPDILVGHDLQGFGLDVLMNRISVTKTPLWSQISRLKRLNIPKQYRGQRDIGKIRGFIFAGTPGHEVTAGRLLCDTHISSRELIHETDYTLTHLAHTQFKSFRKDVDISEIPAIIVQPKRCSALIKHLEADTVLILRLCLSLQILPLTLQLTKLCGNLWARSLRALRAERNEFLLSHEFYSKGYLLPEKLTKQEQLIKNSKNRRKIYEYDGEQIEEEDEIFGNGTHTTVESKSRRKKPTYAGGLVLDPRVGFYENYVVLLDFNSLYPSIIKEYNLCFTTVRHWELDNKGLAQLPEENCARGLLPEIVHRLVESRKAVKKLLKNEKNEKKRMDYDIRQKALKLVANSMYGCLGFAGSRYYCKPIAALVTAQGRETLQRTKKVAEQKNRTVIYGDTDSIMVYTGEDDITKAKTIAYQIIHEVNKLYHGLYLDLDGMFRCMLLLRKKKYAAMSVKEETDGTLSFHRETKGLDLVRRDWCPLSKKVGTFVLEKLMSRENKSIDEVVSSIHDELRNLKEKIEKNQVPINDFVITKALTKPPKDYPDAKTHPHVQVALNMHGKIVQPGDIIPYVICKQSRSAEDTNSDGKSLLLASRAWHPDEFTQRQKLSSDNFGKTAEPNINIDSNNKNNKEILELDMEWYLTAQILPPTARLLEPIEQTNMSQLAEALGLDSKKYHSSTTNIPKLYDNSNDRMEDIETVLGISGKSTNGFDHCDSLKLTCPHCGVQSVFNGVFNIPSIHNTLYHSLKLSELKSGLNCPTPNCQGFVKHETRSRDLIRLENQLVLAFRYYQYKYYNRVRKCNDNSCELESRDICVVGKGNECINERCNGEMITLYSDRDLYTQCLFFQYLFDVGKSIKETRKLTDTQISQMRKNSVNEIESFSSEYKQFEQEFMSITHRNAFNILFNRAKSLSDNLSYGFINLGKVFGW